MRHIKLFTLTVMAVALATGCSGGGRGTGGGGGGTSGNGGGSGGGSSSGGSSAGGSSSGGSSAGGSSTGGSNTGGSSAGGSSTGGSSTGGAGTGGSGTCPTMTVNDAIANIITTNDECIQVANAVVVGASTAYVSTSTGCIGNMENETFYIQDNGAAAGSPGLGVFKSCKDNTMALPAVGDIVTISGRFAQFDGSQQISASSKYMIPEQLVVTQMGGGTSSSGAYPPAGMPVSVAGTDMSYAHDSAGGDPHADQIGMAIKFTGVTVTDRYPVGFNSSTADGGHTTAGFQLSNGVWVNDSIIYHDCIKPLGSDAGIPLANGNIQGFWDRYQDFYGGTKLDGGGFMDAPILPVLVPMTCADMQVQ